MLKLGSENLVKTRILAISKYLPTDYPLIIKREMINIVEKLGRQHLTQ